MCEISEPETQGLSEIEYASLSYIFKKNMKNNNDNQLQ